MLTAKELNNKRMKKELKRKAKRESLRKMTAVQKRQAKAAHLKALALEIIKRNPALLAKYQAEQARLKALKEGDQGTTGTPASLPEVEKF